MKSDLDPNTGKKLGEAFKVAREKNKLTQVDVAKAARMTTNYYAMIERGEANPTTSKLLRVIQALKIKSFDLAKL